MYSLVKFVEDDILYVTTSRSISKIDDDLVWAPFKRLGYYEAHVIEIHNNRQVLINKLQQLQGHSEISNQEIYQALESEEFPSCSTEPKINHNYSSIGSKSLQNYHSKKAQNVSRNENKKLETCTAINEIIIDKGETPLDEIMRSYTPSNSEEIIFEKSESLMNTTSEAHSISIEGRSVPSFNSDMNLSTLSNTENISQIYCGLSDYSDEDPDFEPDSDYTSLSDGTIDENIPTKQISKIKNNCKASANIITSNNSREIYQSSPSNVKNILPINDNLGDYSDEGPYSKQRSNPTSISHRDAVYENVSVTPLLSKEHYYRKAPTASGSKKYCCIFCKKLYSKLSKHLAAVHKDEREVKLFTSLPTKGEGSCERKKIISRIRNKGSYLYNTDPLFSNGNLIVSRRPTKISRDAQYYKICPKCMQMFSKKSIRKHFRTCIPEKIPGDRSVSLLGKQLLKYLHSKACSVMRDELFPIMRDDDITNAIRYDELVILYGNSLCTRYKSKHFHRMIRSKLRLLGRLLLSLRQITSVITDFSSAFNAIHFENIIEATNYVANLNAEGDKYGSPSTASAIGTLLKKCSKLYITECIKKGDKQKQTEIEDFLKVIEEEYSTSVNRVVMENQREHKRQKKQDLPSRKDINILYTYVRNNSTLVYNLLQHDFDIFKWKKLASLTLTAIQMFNRRRSGEIERMLISEFEAYQTISNEDPDLLSTLNEDEEIKAHKYVRLTIRGKLARGVPVLLDNKNVANVKIIIKYRTAAGVPSKNPYVFGLPHATSQYSHLSACVLMREFANLCGAVNPDSLRGTKLRKKLCTQSALLDLNDNQVSDLANFMGHAEKIHREHYRLPIISRDIARVSNILEIGVSATEIKSKDCQPEAGDFELTESDPRLCTSNDSLSPEHSSKYGKTRCVSPIGTIKRKSWSTPEKQVVVKAFKGNIENRQLPTLGECRDLISMYYEELKNRTPTQIKAWVNNKMHETNLKSRVYWTSLEKSIMKGEFHENLKDHILPGLERCEEVRKRHKELAHRTSKMIKAWVYNETNRQRKN